MGVMNMIFSKKAVMLGLFAFSIPLFCMYRPTKKHRLDDKNSKTITSVNKQKSGDLDLKILRQFSFPNGAYPVAEQLARRVDRGRAAVGQDGR